ncbi:MAG: hypothetical protein ACK5PT_07155 [Cereibacter sp.]|nr:hypothetical protein [Rhodobacter sp.]
MLEEVGKRHGATRCRFFIGPSDPARKRVRGVMTSDLPSDKPPPVDLLEATEDLYRQAAEDLVQAQRKLRQGSVDEVKAATQAVKDLKAAFQLVMDERTRIEKLRKQVAGVVHGYAIDFDAARAEIGRRLACLRDAGGGG